MKSIWKFFASTWLTIVLAGLICLVTAWGSVLTVAESGFFRNMDTVVLLPWLVTEGMERLDLTLWIFLLIALISLFAVNTVVCTIDRVWSIVKMRLPWRTFFPHIVHVGFMIALLGHLVGSAWGFRSYGNVVLEGESAPVEAVPGLEVRLDGVDITQAPDGRLESLKTTVTLLEDGREVRTGDIQMNGPLIHDGIAFYHVNQGRTTTGVVLSVDGQRVSTGFEGTFTASGEVFKMGRFWADFAIDRQGRPYSRSNEFRNPVLEIISRDGSRGYLSLRRPGAAARVGGKVVRLLDLESSRYVVLTINRDPGIGFIIVGSVVLVVGMVLLLFMRGERGELIRQRQPEAEVEA